MKNLQISLKRYQNHPFHIVDPSPWPLLSSLSAFIMLFGLVLYMHFYQKGLTFVLIGFFSVLFTATCWWRDVIREATFEG
jgi:hypothetical protein